MKWLTGSSHSYEISKQSTQAEPIPKQETKKQKRRYRWRPTSTLELEEAERTVLSYLTCPYKTCFIEVTRTRTDESFNKTTSTKIEKIKIQTVIINEGSSGTPILLLHGLCNGVATYVFLANQICKGQDRPVYILDLPGFGRSSRIKFPTTATETETMYLDLLEAWRIAIGLEKKFILAGHSLGGYLATAYTLRYPQRVHHLVAFDPWGYPEKPKKVEKIMDMENPVAIKLIALASTRVNAAAHVRLFGPLGPKIGKTVTKDCINILEGKEVKKAVTNYMYHCAADNPSGETAFRSMCKWGIYAKNPMSSRLHLLPPSIPVTIIYPETSFVPAIPTDELKAMLQPEIDLNIYNLPSTTHQNMLFASELGSLLKNMRLS